MDEQGHFVQGVWIPDNLYRFSASDGISLFKLMYWQDWGEFEKLSEDIKEVSDEDKLKFARLFHA